MNHITQFCQLIENTIDLTKQRGLPQKMDIGKAIEVYRKEHGKSKRPFKARGPMKKKVLP